MSQEKNPVKAFISNIVEKDYHNANASLQNMIELKLKERIKSVAVPKNTTEIDK